MYVLALYKARCLGDLGDILVLALVYLLDKRQNLLALRPIRLLDKSHYGALVGRKVHFFQDLPDCGCLWKVAYRLVPLLTLNSVLPAQCPLCLLLVVLGRDLLPALPFRYESVLCTISFNGCRIR
jgi:hypothetical protein